MRQLLLILALSISASAQSFFPYNGQCAKGGQAVLVQNQPSKGTVPIGGTLRTLTSGVIGSYPSCTVSVFLTGTLTPAAIYSNATGTALANPFTANTDGSFLFFSTVGAYDVTLTGAGIPTPVTLTGIQLGGGTSGGSSIAITPGPGIVVTPNPLTTGTGTVGLLQALPNGETATTQTAGDISLDVATDAFVQTSIASISPAPPYSGNQLISGGGVEWTGGLNFTVGAATYTIAGTIYASLLTNETLATADPTNPRLDVIGVNNLGNVFVITGVPAATPSVPSVDPTSQLALTIILVPAASATASVSKVDIYHENTEWVSSASGAGINLASTNNPYDGTVDIEATSVVTGNYVKLLDPLSATVQMQSYNNFVFYLRSKATWPSTAALAIQWFNGTTPLGSAVLIRPTGTFGFNSSQTTAYQQISIPTSLFGINGIPATIVGATVAGTGGMAGWYMDDITLQGGQNGNPNATFLSWAGTWNATTGYNPNQVVFYNFTSWVCLVANTASTPSLTNTNWVPFNQVGSNQQVLFNDNGFWAGNAGMLFDKSTGNLTITGRLSAATVAVTSAAPFSITGVEGSCTIGSVGSDVLCFDSVAHRMLMNNNNVATLKVVGIASAGTSGHCVDLAANGIDLVDAGAACGTGGGSVTSVGLTVNSTSPSGIFTVTGSPVTTSGTLNFNLAGTSGGHPYFSSSTVLSSTGAGTTHGLWLAQGAGNADTTTGAGTTGQCLASNGSSSDPTFQGCPTAPLATGTSVSLTTPSEIYVCTGTCTVTPPVPVAGYQFCVFNDDNVATVITLAALGSSARYENTARTAYGTAGTGTFISGGAVKDFVCIVGRDSTHYLTTNFNGTWTAN